MDLTTRVGSLVLPNPVMTASGTAGHGDELGRYVRLASLGAVVVKSLAPFAWAGNPPPRLHPTAMGMLNSVGLQGHGVEHWLAHELPPLVARGATVVASIWGRTVDEFAAAAEMLAAAPPSVVAVEVNVSCPNLEDRRRMFAHSPERDRGGGGGHGRCRAPAMGQAQPEHRRPPRDRRGRGERGCRGGHAGEHGARHGHRRRGPPAGARWQGRWPVGTGHPRRGGAGGLRRPRRASRPAHRGRRRRGLRAETRSSCCWPEHRPCRSAPRPSPIHGPRPRSWPGLERWCETKGVAGISELVGAAHETEDP